MSTPRSFEIRTDGGGMMWLAGELDLAQMDTFIETVAAGTDGRRQIVLELSELTFLDSSGIRAILRVAQLVPDGVILRNPRENVRAVL